MWQNVKFLDVEVGADFDILTWVYKRNVTSEQYAFVVKLVVSESEVSS